MKNHGNDTDWVITKDKHIAVRYLCTKYFLQYRDFLGSPSKKMFSFEAR